MGLGSTARRLQNLTDTAEELYKKLGEILERIRQIEGSIEESSDRLESIEARLDRQEALLEALAEAEGIDPSSIELPDEDDLEE